MPEQWERRLVLPIDVYMAHTVEEWKRCDCPDCPTKGHWTVLATYADYAEAAATASWPHGKLTIVEL